MRRIILHPNGLSVKICYPVKLKKKSSPKYLLLKFFGFTRYGGFKGALKEARKVRDWYEKKYDLKTDLWNPIPGVSVMYRYREDMVRLDCYWRASWRETINGKRVNRSKNYHFAKEDKLGESQAHCKAVKFREKMFKKHHG